MRCKCPAVIVFVVLELMLSDCSNKSTAPNIAPLENPKSTAHSALSIGGHPVPTLPPKPVGFKPAMTSRVASQVADTTVDQCPSWCVIQGQSVDVTPITDPETKSGTITWSAPGLPTGLTGTFQPTVTAGPPYVTSLTFSASNTILPGTYPYTLSVHFVGNDGSSYSGGTPETMQVVCSNNLNQCPQLEIIEGAIVISSPAPTPTAIVGEQTRISMRQKAGSGMTGPYAMSSPSWNPPTQAIKNYSLQRQITAPVPDSLQSADLQSATITTYMTNPSKAARFQANATLTSSREVAVVNTTSAFALKAPPMLWTSQTNSVRVGTYPFPNATGTPTPVEALSLGIPTSQTTAGIAWTITGGPNPLPGVTGSVDVVQTVNSSQVASPSGCETIGGTNGAIELDNNLFYANVPPAPINSIWQASDSPASVLNSPTSCSSFTRSDSFVDYLMFQSTKSNSIWTPIMSLTWKWSGTASFSSGTWSLTASQGAGRPTGHSSYLFPAWSGIIGNGGH